MDTEVVEIETGGEFAVTDLTGAVTGFLHGRGDGLLSVFAPHATAGIALIETGSGTEADLRAAVDRLVPRDANYRHAHGSPGHGGDHVLPAFVSSSLVVPVIGGEPALGTWQSIVLVDPNRDNRRRRVRLSFLAG